MKEFHRRVKLLPKSRYVSVTWLLVLFLLGPCLAKAEEGTVDMIECGDRDLQFKILCNPKWTNTRTDNDLTMVLAKTSVGDVTVSVSRSIERGIVFTDLTPEAVQRVYGYGDFFKYAKTKIHGQRAVRIEGHPHGNRNRCLLDYLLVNDFHLYRVSYLAPDYVQYRRYLPVFVQMMRQFEFLAQEKK